jgi:integral membrane sensor domain MASE1
MEDLEQQVKVSRMLGLAFALSITGIGGIGSLVALIIGWRALRVIQTANGRISGRLMAWWCILAGAIGFLIITPLVIADILRSVK